MSGAIAHAPDAHHDAPGVVYHNGRVSGELSALGEVTGAFRRDPVSGRVQVRRHPGLVRTRAGRLQVVAPAYLRVPPTTERVRRVLRGEEGAVRIRYRLYRSDRYGAVLDELPDWEDASVSMSNFRDNCWELSVSLHDGGGQDFDPLTEQIRAFGEVWVKGAWERFPLGHYFFLESEITHHEHLSEWHLTGASPEVVALEAEPAAIYHAPQGSGVLSLVEAILRDELGFRSRQIELPFHLDEALSEDIMFDPNGEEEESLSWLRIINSLLASGGFYALYTDAEGRFTTSVIDDMDDRVVARRYTPEDDAMIVGEVEETRDFSTFANVVIARSGSLEQEPPVYAVAVNDDPDSRGSVLDPPKGLGRRVTRTIKAESYTSEEAAQRAADRQLALSSGYYRSMRLATFPDLLVGPREIMEVAADVTHLDRSTGARTTTRPIEGRWRSINYELPLADPPQDMTHELSRNEDF